MSNTAISEENKKLKEENKALDNDLRDRCGTLNYLDDVIKERTKEIAHKNEKFCEWIEENKELKKEIAEYEAESLCSQIKEKRLFEEGFGLQKQVMELKEENKKLKKEEEMAPPGTDIRRWAPTDILKRLDIKNKKLKEDVEGLQEKLDKGIEEGEKLKEVLAELRKHGTLKPQFYSSEETALKSLITDPKEIFKSELEFVCISGGERLIGPVRKEDSTLKKRMEKLGEAFEDAWGRREEAELKEIMALNDTGDGEIHGF